MVTADYNSLEMMIFLLERGADMEAKNHVSCCCYCLLKPPLLFELPSSSHFRLFKFTEHLHAFTPLMSCIIVPKRGCTSLIYAADNGNMEVATFLIHRGTDIELKNNVSLD